jgi:hypothetical protein
LLFPEVFWDDQLDYFGQASDDLDMRGESYMFWNLHRCMGKPVLVSLLAGKAAYNAETMEEKAVVERVLNALRRVCLIMTAIHIASDLALYQILNNRL